MVSLEKKIKEVTWPYPDGPLPPYIKTLGVAGNSLGYSYPCRECYPLYGI